MTVRDPRGGARCRLARVESRLGAFLLLGLLGSASGCEQGPPQAWDQPTTPDPRIAAIQGDLARHFVVFAQTSIEIDQLATPFAAPVTVGSRPSPSTMISDAPDVVSVEPDGRLLGHRAGHATIRASTGGPALQVSVRDPQASRAAEPQVPGAGARQEIASPGSMAVLPKNARVRLGQIVAFEAVTADGPAPATWASSNERTLAHLQDHVFQGTEPGAARVCARSAKQQACTAVEVTP